MTAFVPSTPIPSAMRRTIEARLDAIAAEEGVRVLFAVESGSRAWGFPSPDSDYDVRFVYAHPVDWYLSLEPGRDVIERPIEGDLDIGGWDLRKALALLAKPNPVLLEWLTSPIRYVWDETLCARLSAFARRTLPARACRHHYRRLAERQWREHVEGREAVRLKKYFYVLRPALALRWLRLNDGVPPMDLASMRPGLDLDPAVAATIDRLLARKARAREIGEGPRLPRLDALVQAEIEAARAIPPEPPGPDLRPEADALFREIVGRSEAAA